MKKIILFTLILGSFLLMNQNTQAQAFQKGNINIDLGLGFGIYGTSTVQTYERTATIDPVLVNAGLIAADALNSKTTSDTADGAVSTIIPFSFEYGVSDKIGIGFDVVYNNYFINDSDKVDLESVKAFDFGPKFYYHALSSDFYDLSLGLGVGFTRIGWNAASTSNAQDHSGSGFYLNLDIKNRFWFSEHLGAYVNIGYKGNFYSAIKRDTSVDEADLESLSFVSNVKIKDEFSFNMNGVHFGLGLAVKF